MRVHHAHLHVRRQWDARQRRVPLHFQGQPLPQRLHQLVSQLCGLLRGGRSRRGKRVVRLKGGRALPAVCNAAATPRSVGRLQARAATFARLARCPGGRRSSLCYCHAALTLSARPPPRTW